MLFEILKALLIAGPIYYVAIAVGGVLLGDVHIDPSCPTSVRVKTLSMFILLYPAATLVRLMRGTKVEIVPVDAHDA